MNISNDIEFRSALDQLSKNDQRIAAARFVQNVLYLSREALIQRAVELAMNPDRTPSEIEQAHRAAHGYAVTSYTECGHDTDWLAQADHFVAAAAAACLEPTEVAGENKNCAWRAAMEARMARNCEMIENDEVSEVSESQDQYKILDGFLKTIV